jgi:hypothetical protein
VVRAASELGKDQRARLSGKTPIPPTRCTEKGIRGSALGPRVSQVEDAFAKKYGWTPDRASRIWERNPAYKALTPQFKALEV